MQTKQQALHRYRSHGSIATQRMENKIRRRRVLLDEEVFNGPTESSPPMAEEQEEEEEEEEDSDSDTSSTTSTSVVESSATDSRRASVLKHPLPAEITLLIFAFMSPRDLLTMSQLDHEWRQFTENSMEFNEMWWRICMSEWFEKDKVPATMSKVESRRDWKQVFLRMGLAKRFAKPRLEKRAPAHATSWYRHKPRPINAKGIDVVGQVLQEVYEDKFVQHYHESGRELPNLYKAEMREHYKAMRAKPRGKRAQHDTRVRSEWLLIEQY